MKFAEWWERAVKPLKEVVARLTPSQRLSLAILSAVVVIALAVMAFTSPAPRMVALPDSRLTPEFKEFLESENIHYDVNSFQEVVVPQSSVELLFAHSFEKDMDDKEFDFLTWIYDAVSLQETQGRFSKKWEDSQRRRLERALAHFDDIDRATVIPTLVQNYGIIGSGSDRSSAAVQLRLASEVNRLRPTTARSVGSLVARGLNVPLSKIAITDQLGHRYNLDFDQAFLDGDEKRNRERDMERKISQLFEPEFLPNEYVVTADLKLNYSSVNITDTEVDDRNTAKVISSEYNEKRTGPAQPSFTPGTKTNVALNGTSLEANEAPGYESTRSERKFDNEIGTKRTTTQIPPGAPVRWSLTVKLSEEAILRILKAQKSTFEGVEDHKPTQTEVEAFLEKKREGVLNFPSQGAEQVTARVESFKPRPVLAAVPEPLGFLGFMAAHLREAVLVTLALLACIFLYRAAVGGIPEMEELPDPVAELQEFLREKERRDREAVQLSEVQEEAEGQERRHGATEWKVSEEDEVMGDFIRQVGEFIKENPAGTAGVLRVWLRSNGTVAEQSVEENA